MTHASDFHHSVLVEADSKFECSTSSPLPSKVFSGHCPAVSWADIQNASGQLRDRCSHNVAGPAPYAINRHKPWRHLSCRLYSSGFPFQTSCSNWSGFIISAWDRFWSLGCELRCKRFAPMSIHPLRCFFFQSWRCQICYEHLPRRAKHNFKLLQTSSNFFKLLQTRTNLSGWPSGRCVFSRIPSFWI